MSHRRKHTLKGAQAYLRERGMVLTKNDGEYRVNFKGGREETAYYTNDLDDAVTTGWNMYVDDSLYGPRS